MSSWISFTLLAALMQALRTAGQKSLSSDLSPMSATLVRYVFGLPFALLYLILVAREDTVPYLSQAIQTPRFVHYAAMAAVAQILATALLIILFKFRNFTVGTSFAKTEALQAAVFGTLFFAAPLNAVQWSAVVLGVFSVVIVSLPGLKQRWHPKTVIVGLLSGALFGLTSLWLREASLSLGINGIQSAAVTLLLMVALQCCLCMAYTAIWERSQFVKIFTHYKLGFFVGITSALGSVGWFTAMTLQNAAVVKSVGQIEFIFTLLLTVFLFKESVSKRELLGVAGVAGSVVLLLMG